MDPLSSSSKDAVLYFRFRFFEVRMLDTEAKSVDPTTDPRSMLSKKGKPRMKWRKAPVSKAVAITPKEARITAGTTTGFPMVQLVPNPP